MSEQDSALRMTAGKRQQLVDRATRAEAIRDQQSLDIVGGFLHRECRQFEWSRLAVERTLPIGEQSPHQGRLTAGEDVGGCLSVVLDHGPKQPIELVVGDEQVLELVEANDRESAVDLVEAPRHVQELEQCGARLVSLRSRGPRSDRDLHPGQLRRHTKPRRPPSNAASSICRQGRENLSHTRRHVRDRRYLRKIDPHRTVTDRSHRRHVRVEEAGLSKSTGRRESDRYAIGCCALKSIQLGTTVN
jgi:hypothetical protein